jgi:hypothetical protein
MSSTIDRGGRPVERFASALDEGSRTTTGGPEGPPAEKASLSATEDYQLPFAGQPASPSVLQVRWVVPASASLVMLNVLSVSEVTVSV